MENDDLERRKLQLEISQLERKCFQNPDWYRSLSPIVIALVIWFAGWWSGYFDSRRGQLESEIVQLQERERTLRESVEDDKGFRRALDLISVHTGSSVNMTTDSGVVVYEVQLDNRGIYSSLALSVEAIEEAGTQPAPPKVISEELLKSLAFIPNLRALTISGLELPDNGLESLSTEIDLREIEIFSRNLRTSDVVLIAQFHKLRKLDLSGSTVNDDGILGLAKLPRLRELDIRRTTLTDDSLDALGSVDSLTHIKVTEKHFSDDALQRFRKLRTGCKVTVSSRFAVFD